MLTAWKRISKVPRLPGLARGAATSSYNAPRMLRKYPLKKKIAGYSVERVLPVPELSLTAVDLVHDRTGARHLHIDRNDKNNVFSIIFKTNPPDHTGVPHILEHTTLCGSDKFPVRDPFFKMLNRSLSNFMNAMTAHDYTYYPFATTNSTDFYNLMDVYLDATLNPTLAEEDFFQEGWRLENEDIKDKDSPLIFKGVVYNEMKGQMSDPFYYFWIRFQESIYPSLQNSGGDPAHITSLQYPDLVDFHSTNYHPSNSRTFTYGDMPLSRHLETINERFVHFGKRHKRSLIRQPITLDSGNKVVELEGPVDPMIPIETQWKTSLTWFAGSPKDVYETFKLRVLNNLLSDGHSAPLYVKLVESNLVTDFSVNSGMESMPAVNIFTIGAQGMTKEVSGNFEEIVTNILKEACDEGFPKDKVQAIINQIELGRKVESSSFGLGLLNSVISGWVDEVDPLEMMEWKETMSKFIAEYDSRGDKIFTELIERHFLNGNHFKFTMTPNPDFEAKIAQEEQKRLTSMVEKLTPEDKQIIFTRGSTLASKQEEEQDLSCLPSLSISDISRDGNAVDLKESALGTDSRLFARVSSKSNGLTYFRATKTIDSEIPISLLSYLPLFTDCLTSLGTTTESMAALEDQIKLHTGGLQASVFVSNTPDNIVDPVLKLAISGVSLDNKFEKVIGLWERLLKETNFDNTDKLSTLIKSLSADNVSSIVSNGHGYAKSYGTSFISPVALIDDHLSGIRQVQFLKQLGEWNSKGELQTKVIPQLKKIQEILMSGTQNYRFALTCNRESLDSQVAQLEKFVGGLSQNGYASLGSESLVRDIKLPFVTDGVYRAGVKLPSQVSFASKSLSTGLSYTDNGGAALQVMTQLLNFKRLHTEVREKGGAYGGGSQFSALNGIFSFYSYRDPKPLNSLSVFAKSGEWMIDSIESVTEEDLDRSKLTIFQKVDSPLSVKEEGMMEFLHGIDNDTRQQRRDQLLEVEIEDIRESAQTYLVGQEGGSEIILGDTGELPSDFETLDLSQ
ncbi:unnamed protein product [Kuraishia capsulata CBS 1993]|uniref:Presequence protease, mitochondrial n=1 Tax=Kuraishia capsulata CBS 1993 TaxID=1382522 RepID=W6MX31_9ASCO|nr:uncharacterized protein KUCA_T00004162001 [Kuraishia capsulata CBS 1993]CDK28180.1 unnamed protein product [Kuraishia capsulata CBS 1993]